MVGSSAETIAVSVGSGYGRPCSGDILLGSLQCNGSLHCIIGSLYGATLENNSENEVSVEVDD